jgi:hypothetical protein
MSLNTILATAPLTTTNFVLKATGTTIGNSLIFDNGTNVGIGTTSPAVKLDVQTAGNGLSFSSSVFLHDSSSYQNGLLISHLDGVSRLMSTYGGTAIDSNLAFWTTTAAGAQAERMRITATGNVGIGTTSPSTKLFLAGDFGIDATSGVTSYKTSFIGGMYKSNSGGSGVFASTNNLIIQGYTDGATARDIDFVTGVTPSSRLYINTSGNVGIGTSSPAEKLHIQSSSSGGRNLLMQTSIAAGRNYMQFANGSGDMGFFGYGGADGKFYIYNQLNDDMLFATNGTERMRITSGGNVLIGNTTGTKTLSVQASVSSEVVQFVNTRNNASGDYAMTTGLGANANNTSSYHYIAFTGGADKFYLYGNGTYTTVSDERLKKNINKVTDTYLDKVLGLNIVNYNWNEQEDGSPLEFGMIAQEVEKVIPSIVHEGREQEDGNIYKGIQASVLPYILIKAIQEMNTKSEEQQALITSLQARLETLENK